jgi:L-aspartate oxidase
VLTRYQSEDASGRALASAGPEASDIRTAVHAIMTAYAGVERDAAGLENALADLAALESSGDVLTADRERIEAWNLVIAATAIAAAALHREESRGAHFRTDFPLVDSALSGRHSLSADGRTWRYGTLDAVIPTPSDRTATAFQ